MEIIRGNTVYKNQIYVDFKVDFSFIRVQWRKFLLSIVEDHVMIYFLLLLKSKSKVGM